MPRIQDIGAFNAVRESGLAKLTPSIPRITVGMGTCGRGNGAEEVFHALNEAIQRSGLDVLLASVGCFGPCFQEPIVSVRLPGNPIVMLHRVHANDAAAFSKASPAGTFPADLVYCKIEEWDHITAPRPLRPGLSRHSALERAALLQRPEEDRSAQLRPHQPLRHRGVHRRRRLPGALQGAHRRPH